MKKLTVFTLLLLSLSAVASDQYPDPERFVQYNISGTSVYVIKDTVTKCEYMFAPSGGLVLVEGTCKLNPPKESPLIE